MSEIKLNGVAMNDETRELFVVAVRTGEEGVLSDLDALSYMLYRNRFDGCGSDEICKRRASMTDSRFMALGWNKEGDVLLELTALPQEEQLKVQANARYFMDNARSLVEKMQKK